MEQHAFVSGHVKSKTELLIWWSFRGFWVSPASFTYRQRVDKCDLVCWSKPLPASEQIVLGTVFFFFFSLLSVSLFFILTHLSCHNMCVQMIFNQNLIHPEPFSELLFMYLFIHFRHTVVVHYVISRHAPCNKNSIANKILTSLRQYQHTMPSYGKRTIIVIIWCRCHLVERPIFCD